MISDVFPFSYTLNAPQGIDAIGLGYLPFFILLWLFWRKIWQLLGTVFVAIRETIRGNPGMYLYCFPKFQIRESGDVHKLKYLSSISYGLFGPRPIIFWIIDPFGTLVHWWRNKKGGTELPFRSLRPGGSIPQAGIRLCHTWLRLGLKISFTWEEPGPGDETKWLCKNIRLRPEKADDVKFNENYQFSLKVKK